MLIRDLLFEKAVLSSWITNITYNRPNRIITLKLGNGRTYSIPGISRYMFDKWCAAESKGKFFHLRIRDKYTITRIR